VREDGSGCFQVIGPESAVMRFGMLSSNQVAQQTLDFDCFRLAAHFLRNVQCSRYGSSVPRRIA
jgi:hypothetical protein